MPTNFYWFFITALIPLIVGAIWYHPKVFGTAWMRANGYTEADLEGGNMPVIFGLTYVLSILLSFFMTWIVIHQGGVFSMLAPEVMESGSETQRLFNDLMSEYGHKHRNFGHGALHGAMGAILFALPVIAINSLFERRSAKYVFIHVGYWLITLAIIGGLLCQFLEYAPMT